jgi:hypothetical protein
MSDTAGAAGAAKDASAKAEDGPADLEAEDRLARQAEGDEQGKKAAMEAADARIKAAEAKIEKARTSGAKGEVDDALDALKQAKAERKELG